MSDKSSQIILIVVALAFITISTIMWIASADPLWSSALGMIGVALMPVIAFKRKSGSK